MKNTNMSSPAKSFGCIISYSLGSPRLVKSPNNSIRYNCQDKILSDLITEIRKHTGKYTRKHTGTKTIKEIRKNVKDFTNHRKKTNHRVVVFRPLPNILKYRDHLAIIWKIRFLQTHIDKLS